MRTAGPNAYKIRNGNNKSAMTQPSPNTKLSPEKKSQELSELTPVQFFRKRFHELEIEFYELCKYNPPDGSKNYFQQFSHFKGLIPSLSLHANKILKQRALSSPLNPQSFEICIHFRESLSLFIQSLQTFHLKYQKLFHKSIARYYKTMEDSFERFADICEQNPHTRTMFQQYKESCESSLDKIRNSLNSFFSPQIFMQATLDYSTEIAESIKTFGRFYMFDLQRIITPYFAPTKDTPSYLSKFKAAFSALVPMISSIPSFRDQFEVLLTKIDSFEASFTKLENLIGDTPKAIKLKLKPKLTGEQPELFIEPIDPIKESLENLSKELNIEFQSNQTNAEKIKYATIQMKNTISSLQAELDRATQRLKVLEPINSKEAIIDRFEQIRNFKKEFMKQEEKTRNDFMKSVIYQIKDLANAQFDVNDSYPKQLRQIISTISTDMKNKQEQIDNLTKEIEQAKLAIVQITHRKETELNQMRLTDLIQDALSSYHSSENERNETQKQICNFVTNHIPASNLTLNVTSEKGLECISTFINSQKQTIEELQEKISKQEQSKQSFKKETFDVLTIVHSSLKKLLNRPKDNETLKLPEMRDNIKSMLSELETQTTRTNENLSTFFTKFITTFKLPPVDFTSNNSDEYEKAMNEISEYLLVPSKTDLILNLNREFGEYRELLFDLCIRLTQKPKEKFKNQENSTLKQIIFTNLEKLILNKVDLSEFEQYLPTDSTIEKTSLIKHQLKLAQKIGALVITIKNINDPKDILIQLKQFVNTESDLNKDLLVALEKMSKFIEMGLSQVDVIQLKKQIEDF